MPLNIPVAKNRGDLESPNAQPQQLDVSQSLNVQAVQHDPTQIIRAMDGIAGFFGKKADKAVKLNQDALSERGARDASLEQVDPKLQEQSDAYRAAVNSTGGQRRALEWYNAAAADLKTQQEANPNLDFDAWQKQQTASLFAGAGDDPDRLHAMNQMQGQLQSQLQANFTATRSAHEHDQAVIESSGFNRAAFDGGLVKTGASIDGLVQNAQKTGLGEQEARKLVGQNLIEQIELGHTEYYPMLDDSASKLHLDGEFGAKLELAQQHGIKVKEAAEAQMNMLHGVDSFKAVASIERQVGAGQFGLTQASKYQGKFSDEKIQGWMNQSQRKNEEAKTKFDAAFVQVQANQDRLRIMADPTSGGIQRHIGLPGVDGKTNDLKAFQDTIDIPFQQANLNLISAMRGNDPAAQHTAMQQIAGVFDIASKNNLMPSSITYGLGRANATNPEDYKNQIAAYRGLTQAGLSPKVSGSLPKEAVAKYEAIMEMTNRGGGMTDDQAINVLSKSPIEPHVADEKISGAKKEMTLAVQSVHGTQGWFSPLPNDSAGSQFIEREIAAYARADMMTRGGNAGDAIAAGTKRFQQDYQVIGGFPINTAKMNIPDDFKDSFADYAKLVLVPKLAETHGEDAHAIALTIAPVAESPGYFYAVPTNMGSAVPLQHAGGGFVTFNYDQMKEAVTRAKNEANKQIQARMTDGTIAPLN